MSHMCVGCSQRRNIGLIKPTVEPGIQRVQVIPEGSMEPGIPSKAVLSH